MKILIADDSLVSRMSTRSVIPKFILNASEVFEAKNGKEAVEIYEAHSPEVVFLDLTMPVMSGYEALEKIMEFDKDANIVVISADSQPKAVEKVMALGAKFHQKKPITEDGMVMIFEKVLNKATK